MRDHQPSTVGSMGHAPGNRQLQALQPVVQLLDQFVVLDAPGLLKQQPGSRSPRTAAAPREPRPPGRSPLPPSLSPFARPRGSSRRLNPRGDPLVHQRQPPPATATIRPMPATSTRAPAVLLGIGPHTGLTSATAAHTNATHEIAATIVGTAAGSISATAKTQRSPTKAVTTAILTCMPVLASQLTYTPRFAGTGIAVRHGWHGAERPSRASVRATAGTPSGSAASTVRGVMPARIQDHQPQRRAQR